MDIYTQITQNKYCVSSAKHGVYEMLADEPGSLLGSFDEWLARLGELTDELRNCAKMLRPCMKFSVDELIVSLMNELPARPSEIQMEWVDGGHLATPRKPDRTTVCCRVGKLKTSLKDVVYVLARDGVGYALAGVDLQVRQICGSLQCMAPRHLVLELKETTIARKQCHQNLGAACEHDPPCLRGVAKGPKSKSTSSKAQAKCYRTAPAGRELVIEEVTEVGRGGPSGSSELDDE